MEGNKCTCLKFQILKAAEPKLKLRSVFPPSKCLSSPQSNYENFAFMGKKNRLSQLNKKTNNPIKNGQKVLIDISPKKIDKWPIST